MSRYGLISILVKNVNIAHKRPITANTFTKKPKTEKTLIHIFGNSISAAKTTTEKTIKGNKFIISAQMFNLQKSPATKQPIGIVAIPQRSSRGCLYPIIQRRSWQPNPTRRGKQNQP